MRCVLAIVVLVGCSNGKTSPGDTEEPVARVVSTRPADGAKDVPLDTTITVVFDAALDAGALDDVLSIDPPVPGQPDWDAPTLTLRWQADKLLAAGTDYSVAVADDTTFGFQTTTVEPTNVVRYDGDRVRVDIQGDAPRTYTLSTTHPLRDDDPASGSVTFTEGDLRLRSGHDVYDALFAMALDEVRQNSVSAISDGAFNNGNGVPCDCFETGAKWNYVWTRDTAYAVDLGLALIDPERSANSLRFKLSDQKAAAGGGGPQIVQDTGTGGSWPVSTDRVVWTLGARQVLHTLSGADRTAFRDAMWPALVNTVETDRAYVFDDTDGLYRGEQSFLDWREQTYPTWTADDTVHIGMSKALGTNVGHWYALDTAAWLADELGDTTARDRYRGWADDLATAIDTEFWQADGWRSLIGPDLDPSIVDKRDLLAQSLTVLHVGSRVRSSLAVSSYPHGPVGPPVYWPQQPEIAIYHNRGIWPFVTAYDLRAARAIGNSAVADNAMESLIRGAALNVSNMENLEWMTGANWYDDGRYSGPVVNSRRQLWSVAAYLSMVLQTVYGIEVGDDGMRFAPFVTWQHRNTWLRNTDEVVLSGMTFRGSVFDVVLELPRASQKKTGALVVDAVTVDGKPGNGWLTPSTLRNAEVRITLKEAGAGNITEVTDTGDWRDLWSPKEPTFLSLTLGGNGPELGFARNGESDTTFAVFRDGVEVASGLTSGFWRDTAANATTQTHCYAVAQSYANGHQSQHSPPQCWWGSSFERLQVFDASVFASNAGTYNNDHGKLHWDGWGAPADTLTLQLSPTVSGSHLVQLNYGNGAGPISTGITGAVKWVTVSDGTGVVSEGPISMPQLGTWARWADSSVLDVGWLDSGTSYTVVISDGRNMSWFEHFTPYTGGNGGGSALYNAVNIAELKLLRMHD